MTTPTRPGTAGRTVPPEQIARFTRQVTLAREGRAENQCPDCRSFNADGTRPLIHDDGCPSAPWRVLADSKVKGQHWYGFAP